MRLLVTGAAGFIGTNFVRQALGADGQRGRDVERLVAVDLLTYAGNFANLADLAARPAVPLRAPRHRRRATPWRRCCATRRIDVVVNFAAESHVDRSIVDHGAVPAHQRARHARAARGGARPPAACGASCRCRPTRCTAASRDGHATEDWPARPSSPYAASKAAADAFVQAYATTYGVPAVITRCSNNYGPYQFPEKLIPLFVTNALDGEPLPLYGDGQNVRDWIHVERPLRGAVARARPARRRRARCAT